MNEGSLTFFTQLKEKFPHYFNRVSVIDCGSLDVNGSLMGLFNDCAYLGADLKMGKNVNLVGLIHELPFIEDFFTVVSSAMLEHSEYWVLDLRKMLVMLKPGGLLAIMTVAEGFPEHGTRKCPDVDCFGTGPDYYQNLSVAKIEGALPAEHFAEYRVWENEEKELFFYGIKRIAAN